MENPEECTICFMTFEESERRPRTMPCGHTFCSPCLEQMMEVGQQLCPSCRAHHLATSVTQFPINYCVEAFMKKPKARKLSRTQTVQEALQQTSLPAQTTTTGNGVTAIATGAVFQKQPTSVIRESYLKEQKKNVCSVVIGSQEAQSQLDQYRSKLSDWKTQHLLLLDSLYDLVEQNKSALELLEQEDTRVLGIKEEGDTGEKQLKTILRCLHTVNTVQDYDTAVGHADHWSKEVKDWIQQCQKHFPDVTTVATSRKVRKITHMAMETVTSEADTAKDIQLKDEASTMEKVNHIIFQMDTVNVKKLRRMEPPIKRLVESGRVYGVQQAQDGFHSSRITLQNDHLYLHCLQHQAPPPDSHTLEVSEMIEGLDSSSILVFLELFWDGSTRGKVHIRLSPDTSMARQFVLLCTGQHGCSYRNTTLLQVVDKGESGECVVGGDYEHNNGEGGTPLLPHPETRYQWSGKAGAVRSGCGPDSARSAQFIITTRGREEGWKYLNVFGEVRSGLEVLRTAVDHSDIRQVLGVLEPPWCWWCTVYMHF